MKKHLKQILLSASLALGFTAYLAYQRIGSASETITLATGTSTDKPSATLTYKDGEYTGSVADAYYGNLQVKAVISGGKLADVQFLDYPKDRTTSVRVSAKSLPILKSEAVRSQSAQVDAVSGATQTSEAFQQSLASALQIAQK